MSGKRQLGGGRVGSSLQGGRAERRDREGTETSAIAGVVSLDGKLVLDVGCGTGRLTGFAARHARSVYAFDPSQDSIAKAEAALTAEQRKRVQFAVHDAEALDGERDDPVHQERTAPAAPAQAAARRVGARSSPPQVVAPAFERPLAVV